MSDLPIIFSAPMVLALLREAKRPGTGKTQTRRILKPTRGTKLSDAIVDAGPALSGIARRMEIPKDRLALPYAVGDRLWVKENHYRTDDGHDEHVVYAVDEAEVREHLAAVGALPDTVSDTVKAKHRKLRPSIHMPRWASRLTLIVSEVRVERLDDISHADAIAEGVELESADPPFYYVPKIHPHSLTAVGIEEPGGRHAERSFAKLWEHINGAGSWQTNPWIVAVTFQVRDGNIDQVNAGEIAA